VHQIYGRFSNVQFIYFQNKSLFWCVFFKLVIYTSFINSQSQAFLSDHLQPFYLTKVTFQSDIGFSQDEFAYLTGLQDGMMVDDQALRMACFYLQQRQLFAKIRILVRSEPFGKSLHFNLVAYQRLGLLKIEGVLFGKDHYKRLYQIENGERFDLNRHVVGLKKMIKYLKNNGYLNAKIQDVLHCDLSTKLVTVTLKINPGKLFKITNFSYNLHDLTSQNKLTNSESVLDYKINYFLKNSLWHEKFSSDLLQKKIALLKKYLAKNGYPFAQINFQIFKNQQNHECHIKFDLFLKEQQHYKFVGNHFFTRQDLLNYIMVLGDPIWHLPISLIIKDLICFYHKNGFWQVEIDGQELQNYYTFHITENDRTLIKKVSIRGLDCDQDKLIIARFFKRKIINKYYDYKLCEQVFAKLTNWFIQNGFWDFKILDTQFVCLDQRKQHYELVLDLERGPCRFLKAVTVANYPPLKQYFAKIAPDQIFKTNDLQLQKDDLRNYFAKKKLNISAYPILKEQVRPFNSNQIDVIVEWDLKFDKPVLIGKTIRRGNANVKFNQLYQNLPYQIGDVWQKQKLAETFFRIKNFESLDTVHVYSDNKLDPLGAKPIILDLNLDHKFEFKTRLGVQQVSRNFAFKSGTTYKIGMSTIYKNVSNCGDRIQFDADLTRYYRSIVGQYQRPVFIKMPLCFVAKAYTNKYDQPIVIGSKYRLYNVLQQGVLVDLSYKNRGMNTGFNAGIEGIRVSEMSKEYARAIDFSDRLLCQQVPFLFIEPTFLLDYLDDKLNPRSGMLTLLSSKAMISLGWQQNYFLKFLIDQSFFIPVLKESVLAICLRVGHIFTDDFRVIMPIERFYLGGTYSIRSYEPDMAPPLGAALIECNHDCPEQIIYLPQGGKSMVNFSFEYRFPIYQNFGAVVFQDLGTLLKAGENLGQNRLLLATGFGLRYKTPLGPLRFDIGWRPRNFAWFLTIGHAF
jgi:outer membrane protein assembly factor BamA